jgi:hypothetical protein
MKKTILLLIITMLLFSQVSYANGWKEYHERSKNPLLAGALEYVLPTLGHNYAGDWPRGFPFLTAIGVGFASIVVGMNSGNPTVIGIGVVTTGVAEIWSMFDAYDTAEDFNNKLKKELGITLE